MNNSNKNERSKTKYINQSSIFSFTLLTLLCGWSGFFSSSSSFWDASTLKPIWFVPFTYLSNDVMYTSSLKASKFLPSPSEISLCSDSSNCFCYLNAAYLPVSVQVWELFLLCLIKQKPSIMNVVYARMTMAWIQIEQTMENTNFPSQTNGSQIWFQIRSHSKCQSIFQLLQICHCKCESNTIYYFP